MAATKSSFLDKVLGRIGRLDAEGLQTVVQRLARERSFLETLFNTIEDGVLVVDEPGGSFISTRPLRGSSACRRTPRICTSRTFCRNWIGKRFPRRTSAGGKRGRAPRI